MSQNDNCLDTKIRHITPPKEDLQTLPSAFYNCNICGLQVKTQSNLRAHYIKTHGLVNDVKDTAFLLRKKTDISDVFHCPIPACKYTKATGTGFSKFWHLKQKKTVTFRSIKFPLIHFVSERGIADVTWAKISILNCR
uniref:C2H2-type domain-containing protein n=1 Tax=Mesocestoides corti TaxID=53468 RepID=A0A5K3FNX9_MESCO